MRCAAILLLAACAGALEVPPPADPDGLGERLVMLDYLRTRGVKSRSGLSDAEVRALYAEAWQADPANNAKLAELLKADVDHEARVKVLAEIEKLGGTPDKGLDLAALKELRQRLESERAERQADLEREAAEKGEMRMQQVRFKDGGILHGIYDPAKQRLEVRDAKTGKRLGEVALNPDTITAVIDIIIRIRPPPAAAPAPAPEPAPEPAPRGRTPKAK